VSYEADDSEIEASRAPLLDHLIELRKRLIIMIGALILGFAICMTFSTQLYVFLLHPFNIAGGILAVRQQAAAHGASGPSGPLAPILSAWDGVKNMFLVLAGLKALPAKIPGQVTTIIATAPLEIFFTKVKLAALAGLALSFPVLGHQIYAFVAPGLYKRERRAFLPFLIASPVLFVVGAAMVYFMILPFVLWFSMSQQVLGAGISVQLLPKVSEYFDLVTALLLAFGLCFQLPVVLTLLGMAGLVSSKMLWAGWRYAVAVVGVVAAIITPPDPISMLLLIFPIVGLYFVSIGCVKLIEIGRKREDEAAAA
jgi:sec-independent protein translocase protein TatC